MQAHTKKLPETRPGLEVQEREYSKGNMEQRTKVADERQVLIEASLQHESKTHDKVNGKQIAAQEKRKAE